MFAPVQHLMHQFFVRKPVAAGCPVVFQSRKRVAKKMKMNYLSAALEKPRPYYPVNNSLGSAHVKDCYNLRLSLFGRCWASIHRIPYLARLKTRLPRKISSISTVAALVKKLKLGSFLAFLLVRSIELRYQFFYPLSCFFCVRNLPANSGFFFPQKFSYGVRQSFSHNF